MIQFRENFIWKAASSVIITICNGTDENILFMGICFFHPKQAKYASRPNGLFQTSVCKWLGITHTRDEEISHNCQSACFAPLTESNYQLLAYFKQVNFFSPNNHACRLPKRSFPVFWMQVLNSTHALRGLHIHHLLSSRWKSVAGDWLKIGKMVITIYLLSMQLIFSLLFSLCVWEISVVIGSDVPWVMSAGETFVVKICEDTLSWSEFTSAHHHIWGKFVTFSYTLLHPSQSLFNMGGDPEG